MSNINLFPELDDEQAHEPDYNNGHHENKEEDIIVFGYSCKLFRDDFSAKAIDRGQSLIPWNGDETVMIDRYDCRGHLSDLTPWDSDLLLKKYSNNEASFLNNEEQRIEDECNHERYAELYKDLEKEALQQEEEVKRIQAEKNAYNQVGFTYNDSKQSSSKITEEVPQPLDDDEYEPFYPPEKLQIPYGMDIPESIKLNTVIEKTAGFVSTSGVQMEIVLKTKQANNPQFDFLKYDHYLNPYYRHLIIMIKSGKYRPSVDNNSSTDHQKKKSNKNGIDQSSSHDEDEAGDSYLHPLLRGGANNDSTNSAKKSGETPRTPSVPMNIHNTAYGQLIKKYEHLRQREKVVKENDEEKMSPMSEEIKTEESSPRSESSVSTSVIPPPPDVKPIIDKLAEYVARNGSTFEQSIRTKNDPRLPFLERDHIHHNYYQLKVQLCAQDLLRKKEEENPYQSENNEHQSTPGKNVKLVLKTNMEESLKPTTCREFNSDDDDDDSNSMQQNEQDSNGEFIGPRPPSPGFLEKMRKQEERRDRAIDFIRDKITRDKQEERKRKAEMLVKQLKTQTNDSPPPLPSSASSTINSNELSRTSTVNPVLVEKLLNVKNERSSLSIIPSTHHYRRSKHSRSPSKSRTRSKYHRRSRSKSSHRRQRRSSQKRSRTRSKSRSHHRSKRSKNSKSSKYSRRQHRRHRHSSDFTSSSSTSSSVSRSSSSSSSSHERKTKKKKTTKNNRDDDEQRRSQQKKNPQSSKWDQREPIKVKTETSTSDPTLSQNTETTISNSIS